MAMMPSATDEKRIVRALLKVGKMSGRATEKAMIITTKANTTPPLRAERRPDLTVARKPDSLADPPSGGAGGSMAVNRPPSGFGSNLSQPVMFRP